MIMLTTIPIVNVTTRGTHSTHPPIQTQLADARHVAIQCMEDRSKFGWNEMSVDSRHTPLDPGQWPYNFIVRVGPENRLSSMRSNYHPMMSDFQFPSIMDILKTLS